MCTAVYQTASSCVSKVSSGAYSLIHKAGSCYNWLGRKVITLTNQLLPKSLAYYVEQAVWTLPYTITLVAMPRFYSGISVAILMMIPEETVRYELGKEHADNFYTGIRNVSLIHAGVDLVSFATTLSISSLVYCIFNLYAAAQAHLLAHSSSPLSVYLQSIRPQS